MSSQNILGLGRPQLSNPAAGGIEHRTAQHALQRVLAFLGHSIDEVCNDAIVKNKVLGFFKLHKQISRRAEIAELERWWNPVGLRYD
jgi:hypothetical protein